MTNIEDLKTHFKVLYPNCTYKLAETFSSFLEQNKSSSSDTLESNFLAFVTKIMRVDLQKSVSFSDSLMELKQTKKKITGRVDDKKLTPGFITKNILTMPSNRGYIWKNKKYFGKLSRIDDGSDVLFEPRRGKTFIHVYEKTCHKIYEKMKGDKTQNLIKTEYIQPKTPVIANLTQPIMNKPLAKRVSSSLASYNIDVEKVVVSTTSNSFEVFGTSDSD